MSFTPPPLGVFVNFTAGVRKPGLLTTGYFSPLDSVSWIFTIETSGSGGGPVQYTLLGTIDGTNRVFTTPVTIPNQVQVFRNGVLLDPTAPYSSYTVSGSNTITFANAPQPGDDLNAF